MPAENPEMTAADVIEIVRLFRQNNIDVCVDGGWGVDALLGRQTRTHADLDIAMPHSDAAKIRAVLEAREHRIEPRARLRDQYRARCRARRAHRAHNPAPGFLDIEVGCAL